MRILTVEERHAIWKKCVSDDLITLRVAQTQAAYIRADVLEIVRKENRDILNIVPAIEAYFKETK